MASNIPPQFLAVESNEPKDYGSAKAYTEAVRNWSNSMQCWMAWNQMAAWQNFASHTYHQMGTMANSATAGANIGIARPHLPIANIRHIFRFVGGNRNVQQTLIVQQYTVPSFLKRILAELLDFFFLFMFKMILVYAIVEMELIDLDQFDKILSNDADLQTLIDVTQELFHVEVLCKVFSAIVEAFFLTYGFMSYPPGCTPGKFIMGLQVVSCLNIQSVPGTNDRVQVTRLPRITLRNALIRSLLKNMVTNFLFPLSTAFYVFNFNRAIYDIAAKTLVVNL
jgi:hypothetical protein